MEHRDGILWVIALIRGAYLLKPNFVLHFNQGGYGLECLLTHPSVIDAVLEYVSLAKPSRVTLVMLQCKGVISANYGKLWNSIRL